MIKEKIKVTRKQFYSRMSCMIQVGLIKRKNGKYFLTSLGKVVCEAEAMLESALKDYWKLKAIDSILLDYIHDNDNNNNNNNHTPQQLLLLPMEERSKIIDSLIGDNKKIKEILLQ